MKAYDWYRSLIKPRWAPPQWLFGPVWTFLYVIIAVSYGYLAYLYFTKAIPFVVFLPFILNIILNLIFSPIQFSLRNNLLAAIDVLLVLVTLVWSIIVIYPYATWAALINTPYLLWVCFATVLQLTITVLNW